jgi:hypothetical protein
MLLFLLKQLPLLVVDGVFQTVIIFIKQLPLPVGDGVFETVVCEKTHKHRLIFARHQF